MSDWPRLDRQHYNVWGSNPDYPVADWQYEVANDDTRAGYWDWVRGKIEIADAERRMPS